MMTRKLFGLAFSALAAASASHAMPLDLLQNPPDIRISNMTIGYNATTDAFVATGDPVTYDPFGSLPYHMITGGTYTLNATITTGGKATAGNVTITGTTTDKFDNPVSGTLLTGSLILFGFDPDATVYVPEPPYNLPIEEYPAKFEFLMSVSGGALVSDFGGVGAWMGVISVSNLGGFPGDFNNDFIITPDYLTSANNFTIIPEPASISLLLGGMLALAARRARARGLSALRS